MNHSLNEQLQARKAAATPRGVGVMAGFFADRADNALLWDVEGRRFIDFAGGIAVMNSGHGHPKVIAAIEAQLKRFTHTCWQVVPYEGYVALAEKLNALTPGTHAKKTALFSTGAEAIENAIKIARAATGRPGRRGWRSRLPRRAGRTRFASRPGARPRGVLRSRSFLLIRTGHVRSTDAHARGRGPARAACRHPRAAHTAVAAM